MAHLMTRRVSDDVERSTGLMAGVAFLIPGLLAAGLAVAAVDPAAPHGTAPQMSYISETVAVTGAVEQPLSLSVTDLEGFPPQQIGEVDMICDTGVNIGKKENLRGVLLRDILDRAKLKAPAPRDFRKMAVIARATDDYVAVFSWAEIFNSDVGDHVIVYFRKDGAPLGVEEGQIALISTTDQRTGPRHVRWLNRIEVRQLVD
ncbi:molybdopterin-dependent oxidoreductase [Imhoffiella purpurea]|uniref:Oxidoreductase molybdopterin-binding domain-containing protein n=1 Tax=Imhoffiella purpurea TaxID=1249627 RepID=W9V6D5_9GAMM|nr:molybdopterin-dependent oxidoreductase [Imhoffiella purpurea]EXJ14934.1 hypothetical protein D779_1989 [Imhoffiella purpurea]